MAFPHILSICNRHCRTGRCGFFLCKARVHEFNLHHLDLVQSTGLSHGWCVIAKDNLGYRQNVGQVYPTLEAALSAAQAFWQALTD